MAYMTPRPPIDPRLLQSRVEAMAIEVFELARDEFIHVLDRSGIEFGKQAARPTKVRMLLHLVEKAFCASQQFEHSKVCILNGEGGLVGGNNLTDA